MAADWENDAMAAFEKKQAHEKALEEARCAKEEARLQRANEEALARREERERKKADEEKKYWENVETKNALAKTRRKPLMTITDALANCNGNPGKSGAFRSAQRRKAEAASIKAKLQRERAERLLEEQRAEERQRKLDAIAREGGSLAERQCMLLADAAQGDAAKALLAQHQAREARIKRKEEEEEAARVRQALAVAEAKRKKAEKEAHLAELSAHSHVDASGCRYWGTYVDHGAKHGYGEYTWKDGRRVYEGEYFHGRMQGAGLIEFENGDTWEGTFHNDELHGFGKYIWVGDGKKDPKQREQKWCFYRRSRRVCYLEDLYPGRRLKFKEKRAGLETVTYGNIVRPASSDEQSKEFRRGTFLVKFDGSSAKWKQLDQEEWVLMSSAPCCILPDQLTAEIKSTALADRKKYYMTDTSSFCPQVGDDIHFSTDRPHIANVPLIRPHYI